MKIIVLGAGVAGVVSAIGLKKLGYEVVLINKKRPFEAIEGFSVYTIDALKRANLQNALKQVGEKVARIVSWDNKTNEQNFEFITNRSDFDQALLQDAKAHNIEVLNSYGKILNQDKGIIKIKEKIIKADFIVDARGRFAKKQIHKQQIPTKAMFIKFNNTNNTCKTSLSANENGWIFEANNKNTSYFQLTCDVNFSKKDFMQIFKQQNQNVDIQKVVTREANSYLALNIIKNNYIKVGDIACAIDPLSGNGVFWALSSALIAPFVIHTLLQADTKDKIAAKNFYKERIYEIFKKCTKIADDFYNQEQYKSEFWTNRAKTHKQQTKPPYIAKKAVLIQPFIKSHEVLVTKNHPLGVWKLGDINLVNIFKKLSNQKNKNRALKSISKSQNLNQNATNHLFKWCQDNDLLS